MLSLGITLYFDIARQSQSIDSTISSTAAYVASMDGVAEMLANGYPTQEVTGSLDSLHQNFPGIDIIAVYDRNGLRFYHTLSLIHIYRRLHLLRRMACQAVGRG